MPEVDSGLVAGVALILAVILFIAACIDLITSWGAVSNTKSAATKAATNAKNSDGTQEGLQEQAGTNFKEAWEALASLASALKDLDRSSRLFVLSLAFFAVAAASVGLSDVAEAIQNNVGTPN